MSSLYLLLLFLFCCCCCSHPFLASSIQSPLNSNDDRASLLAFKSSLYPDLANWNSGVPLCNWTGIACDHGRREREVSLNLANMWLTGLISPSLGNLSFLHSIDLSGNMFHGQIPPHLGNLSRLRHLSLRSNLLGGSIPAELGMLKFLQKLYLSHNKFSGTIPISLSNVSSLTHLDISENLLSGSISEELGFLPHLQTLYLFSNKLSGTIPISLSNLSSLTQLDVSENFLNGSIPDELGLLPHLQTLQLFQNQLSGPIPRALSNCSALQLLALSKNMLTGEIPSEFGAKLTDLIYLGLSENRLEGRIPNSIRNCSELSVLILSGNKLNGSVPVELGVLLLLQRLDLSSNFLVSGSATSLPFLVRLANCSVLERIDFHKNKLGGTLPDSIGHLSRKLYRLDLSENSIGGHIPNQINNLTNLISLNLGANRLSGTIPPLRNFQRLETLNLGDNILAGTIPDDCGQMLSLNLLNISHNKLSGRIPPSIGNITQLRMLFLHHNTFADMIPPNLGNCEKLELLDLSHNALTGSIPIEVAGLPHLIYYLNFSDNSLEGPLPGEIGKTVNIQAIDMSSNSKLNGIIPMQIGHCMSLKFLNLARCGLDGEIPDSVGNMKNLEYLDLSSNSLSGTIPMTIKNLIVLQSLNLSRNTLEGQIPDSLVYLQNLRYLDLSSNTLSGVVDKGLFANSTREIFLDGNNGLCGLSIASLPTCPRHKIHIKHLIKVPVAIGGVTAFIFCCLLLGFLWKRKLLRQRSNLSKAIRRILQNVEHPLISYEELVRATDRFNPTNLLGTSNFGSVYKGILTDGTLVAVKVLNVMNEESEKSFKSECNVLQKARHRNLAKIITTCSNLHFKGLVFEFLCNGSLEKHLFPGIHHACKLGLKELLNIAIDISHAVEYLHYDCYVQIVHCDIKPSNVLLDQDMTARLTDFGIARLMGGASLDSLTSTMNLKGSVGYIAPEYGLSGRVSTQGDVYSYGILLLEMLTRKRPTDNMFEGDLSLHKWVSSVFPNRVMDVVDKSLLGEGVGKEMEECLTSLMRVGLLCSKDSPQVRPTMRDVSSLLKTIKDDWSRGGTSSNKLTPTISNLLYDTKTSVADNCEDTSDIQSSSTF